MTETVFPRARLGLGLVLVALVAFGVVQSFQLTWAGTANDNIYADIPSYEPLREVLAGSKFAGFRTDHEAVRDWLDVGGGLNTR